MGAWGMGVFDDDTSCEIIEDAIEESLSIEVLIEKALDASKTDYLEYTECHEIIVAGAMTNAILNKVGYEGVEGLSDWISAQSNVQPKLQAKSLVLALAKVLSENSELNELWSENEDDYPEWKATVDSIISGLSS